MAVKKFASLNSLSVFLDSLKNTFASLSHNHSFSDITDIDDLELITVDDIDAICVNQEQ